MSTLHTPVAPGVSVMDAGRTGSALIPPAPATSKETGLSAEVIGDLILKMLYVQGARTGQQITDDIRLPFNVVDEQLLSFQQRRWLEVRATSGAGRGGYMFDLAGPGRDRARDAFEANQYVGPAPIPLKTYRKWIEAQSVRHVHATRARIREGFSHLVLEEGMLEILGPAINSATSVFLHGDPGNGKTAIAESIAAMLGGCIYIPHAVDIEGQIMVLFDPVHHELEELTAEPSAGEPAWLRSLPEYDRRFARIRRPVVFVGGELTLEQLDLQYDPFTKMYQAPFQLKAAGGLLIIDDFGRQRVPPRDLLNRWIVPLEKNVDFLTLHTGVKFPVPFDSLLVFATNLEPDELVEEAFLRRIHYKVHVPSPTRTQYTEIFERICRARGIHPDPAALDYLFTEYYGRRGIRPRGCHPRDIINHVLDVAKFEETTPSLSRDVLDRACTSYFLVQSAANMKDYG